MKTMHLIEQSDHDYAKACAFAQRIYTKQLSIHISHFPEQLFVIMDGETIVGCMGLNRALTFDLFLNDTRVRRMLHTYPSRTRVAEQSVFALEGFCAGVPLLISSVALYAHYSGIDRIAYAAIDVSRRTIERLGFPIHECGPVTLDVLMPGDRENYRRWYETHHPTTCILDTRAAPEVALTLPPPLVRRVEYAGKLAHFMRAHHLPEEHRAVA